MDYVVEGKDESENMRFSDVHKGDMFAIRQPKGYFTLYIRISEGSTNNVVDFDGNICTIASWQSVGLYNRLLSLKEADFRWSKY